MTRSLRLLVVTWLVAFVVGFSNWVQAANASTYGPIEYEFSETLLAAASPGDFDPGDAEIALVSCLEDVACRSCDRTRNQRAWYDELTIFGGIDGSKQPQDFGVNANLGGQVNANLGLPLVKQWGVGVQFGQGIVAADNAVRVYELQGEGTGRFQSFTTVGLFQRTDSGFAWGFVHDWLNQSTFDDFSLSQWRMRAAYDVSGCDQVGVTVNLTSGSDLGSYLTTPVTLRPIDQGHIYWRHWWQSGVQTASWFGLAEGHGENNAVTGPSPRFGESFLLGADVVAPLNNYLALYGETNLIFPADTGTVDAFLGVQFFPSGNARRSRRGRYSPLLPVAAPTSFSVDLLQ